MGALPRQDTHYVGMTKMVLQHAYKMKERSLTFRKKADVLGHLESYFRASIYDILSIAVLIYVLAVMLFLAPFLYARRLVGKITSPKLIEEQETTEESSNG